MIAEAISRLWPFAPPRNYKYFGFGGIHFCDFVFFHSRLGIHKMISMERSGSEQRFKFNLPYPCVDLRFGDATTILSGMLDHTPTIVWLDFDREISRQLLDTVKTAVSKLSSGSVIITTFNCHANEMRASPGQTEDEEQKEKQSILDKFVRSISPYHAENPTLRYADIIGRNRSQTFRSVVQKTISNTLQGRSAHQSLGYQQLFFFEYNDGAKMMTTGGVIVSDTDRVKFQSAGFNDLQFIKEGTESFEIGYPVITPKEAFALLQQTDHLTPLAPENPVLGITGVPHSDAEEFRKIYRYFPAISLSGP